MAAMLAAAGTPPPAAPVDRWFEFALRCARAPSLPRLHCYLLYDCLLRRTCDEGFHQALCD